MSCNLSMRKKSFAYPAGIFLPAWTNHYAVSFGGSLISKNLNIASSLVIVINAKILPLNKKAGLPVCKFFHLATRLSPALAFLLTLIRKVSAGDPWLSVPASRLVWLYHYPLFFNNRARQKEL